MWNAKVSGNSITTSWRTKLSFPLRNAILMSKSLLLTFLVGYRHTHDYSQDVSISLWRVVCLDDGFELLKGSHQFPFSFTLPHNIPATYIAETHSKFDYGNVSYTIKAVLERNSRQNCGETCHNPFTVTQSNNKPNNKVNITSLVWFI